MNKINNTFTKNSIYRLNVTDMNGMGAGIARLDGMVVFVQGGCTGDEVDARIIKITKNYLVARIEKLIKPSEYRIESNCPVSKRCGGCVYRNITYEYELECKRRAVEAEMRKNHLDIKVLPPLHGSPDGYRNKAQYPVGRGKDGSIAIGFYAQRSHEIIDLDENCRLQPEIFANIAAFLKKFMRENDIEPYDELTQKGIVRHLYLRRSESTEGVMVCIVATKKFDKLNLFAKELTEAIPEVISVWLNINDKNTNVVLGKHYEKLIGEELKDELCGRRFEISPSSFWQVNRKMAEVLYDLAGELADIKPGQKVLDLFCGIGSVGQSICKEGTKLIGIEIVPEAVENARKNALRNGFSDAEYACIDAGDKNAVEKEIKKLGSELDLMILDPPRGGCAPELLELLAKYTKSDIVYISCGPDTLARDLAIMQQYGYNIGDAHTVDLFPRTGHVETVCLLSKLQNQHYD